MGFEKSDNRRKVIFVLILLLAPFPVFLKYGQQIQDYFHTKPPEVKKVDNKGIHWEEVPKIIPSQDMAPAIQAAADATKKTANLKATGEKIISFDNITIDEASLALENAPNNLISMDDMDIDVIKAISPEQLKVTLGNTSSAIISGNTVINDNDNCKDHKGKAYLEVDLNNNRVFCGDEAIYNKYKDSLKVSSDSAEPRSSDEIPPFKLKQQLKACNESLDKVQADNQELHRRVSTYDADKDAQKVKDVIAMQNDRLNAQRAEIEELQKQLVELHKTKQ